MLDAVHDNDMTALWIAMADQATAAGDTDGARLFAAAADGTLDPSRPAATRPALAPLPPAARADVLAALGGAWALAGPDAPAATATAEAFLRAAIDEVPDHLDAKLRLAHLRMPGPGYYELLDRLHDLVRPTRYLEIGMGDGSSMALARPGTRCVGVDPVPRLCTPVAAEVHVLPQRSEEFFARDDLAELFGHGRPELIFIDGLHTFPAVLADLAGAERIARPDTVVVLHDTLPLDEPTQRPDRAEAFYTGDVWKLLPCLAAERPDLDVFTVATAPSGLTFVTGLDAANPALTERHAELVATYGSLPYDPDTAPVGDIGADDWDTVVTWLGR